MRRYMAGSIRYVQQAFISTGHGWLDAEPEIERIQPDIYAVNEDGDQPEKREYCEAHGIEYRVLKRLPKEGLPTRQSTRPAGVREAPQNIPLPWKGRVLKCGSHVFWGQKGPASHFARCRRWNDNTLSRPIAANTNEPGSGTTSFDIAYR